jgi:hypothetical protein
MTEHNDFDLLDYMNLGNILTRRGVVTHRQVKKALERQERLGGRLGESLVALGFCSSEDVSYALKAQEDRVLPESKTDGALQRLEAAIDQFEESGRKLSRLATKKKDDKIVIDINEDQSGAQPISPPKEMAVG